MTGVQELVRHLKENPGRHDVSLLSERFGVEPALVRIAVSAAEKGDRSKRAGAGPSRVQSLLNRFVALADRWTDNLILFMAVVGLLTPALMCLSMVIPKPQGARSGLTAQIVMVVTGMLFPPIVHFVVLFFKGNWKAVVFGALTNSVYVSSCVAFLSGAAGPRSGTIAMLGLAMLIFYLFSAMPITILGSYWRMRKDKKAEENMSRQDLLQRHIQVREALETASARQGPKESKRSLVGFLEKYCELLLFVLGIVSSFIVSQILLSVDPGRVLITNTDAARNLQVTASGPVIVASLLSLGMQALVFAAGYIVRRYGRALLCFISYGMANMLHSALPGAYLSFATSFAAARSMSTAITYGVICGLALLGAMSRSVVDFARRNARRSANEPDVLMEELLDLEMKLSGYASFVAVMAVDVVGSTQMKRDADPLVTEWSFREYQKLVETVSAKYEGRVESTAGDGAIVGFLTVTDAARAATDLQGAMEEFNQKVNKLGRPFAIRVGLHCGDVQGDLGDIQFTRVIDVAAHIEASAPIGRIALSEEFCEKLDSYAVTPVGKETDGHRVYILGTELPSKEAESSKL